MHSIISKPHKICPPAFVYISIRLPIITMDPPAITYSRSYASETLESQSLKPDRYASVEASNNTLFSSDETMPEYRNDAIDDHDSKVIESARDCMIKYRQQTYKYKQQRRSRHMIIEDESFRVPAEYEAEEEFVEDKSKSKNKEASKNVKESINDVRFEKTERGLSVKDQRDAPAKVEEVKTELAEADVIDAFVTKEERRFAGATGIALASPSLNAANGHSLSAPTNKKVARAVKNDMFPEEVREESVSSGFFLGLIEFLASFTIVPISTALSEVCSAPNVDKAVSQKQYEMPLKSINDLDELDIKRWGPKDETQKPRKIAGIAKAINFSSSRIDDKNPASLTLYDENKLKQEEYKVHLSEEYYDVIDIEAYDNYDESIESERRNVPDAVIVKPNKVDDVSVLEDNSVYTSDFEKQSIKAWSLSPRRKRRLRARARAVAKKVT